jgi:hypothetical protein
LIYYDNCFDSIKSDKGDIYIPTTAHNVWIQFQLFSLVLPKTTWMPEGKDSIYITAGSLTSQPPSPLNPGLPWPGKVTRHDKDISFSMKSPGPYEYTYYSYRLRFANAPDIDPQIINYPPR